MLAQRIQDLYRRFQTERQTPLQAHQFLVAHDNQSYLFNPLRGPHRFLEFPALLRDHLADVPGDFLEIGSHKGECTRLLGKIAQEQGRQVHVIDPWCGDQQGTDDIYRRYFVPNTVDLVAAGVVRVGRFKSQSPEAKRFLAGVHLAFAFLDGLHTPEALRSDLALAQSCFRRRGVIAVDDVRHTHGAPALLQCVRDTMLPSSWTHVVSPPLWLHTYLVLDDEERTVTVPIRDDQTT